MTLDRPLHLHRGGDRVNGRREHDHEAVAEVLHLLAVTAGDCGAQQPEVHLAQLPEGDVTQAVKELGR